MITEKDIPPEATVTLKGIYCLNANACNFTRFAGKLVERTHEISVTVNAREALRTRYAWIENDIVTQAGDPRALFFKLDPIFGSSKHLWNKAPGVIRRWTSNPPEFGHILTEKEATDFIIGEMNRSCSTIQIVKHLRASMTQIKNIVRKARKLMSNVRG